MDVGPAKFLDGDFFARGCLHEGRPPDEYGTRALHDNRLVGDGGNVGAAGGAEAHYHGNLRDALGRHYRFVVEDPAKVLLVWEDVGLEGKEGASGVDQIDTGEPVLLGDLLGSEVLFDCEGIVGAGLNGGVVGHDHALASTDHADARDNTRGVGNAVVHLPGGKGTELEEGTVVIDKLFDALAGGHLASALMAGDGGLRPTLLYDLQPLPQLLQQADLVGPVLLERRVLGVDVAADDVEFSLACCNNQDGSPFTKQASEGLNQGLPRKWYGRAG